MYFPLPIPTDTKDMSELIRYLYEELERISQETKEGRSITQIFDEHNVMPTRPQDGMVARFAANIVAPATPAGLYEYVAGAWIKL